MPNALNIHPSETGPFRDPNVELAMRIKDDFTVVTVGDLIQMVPFSTRQDADIQALVGLMQKADVTLANNENTVVDRLTFRGPIAHMAADAAVADDWANMGIKMVTKANNHTHDCGDAGLLQNLQQLRRVGIDYVGTDYNLTEARLARFRATPKGTVGLIGAYAEVKDYSQLFGLPGGDPVIVSQKQLENLKAMRDSILARRYEVPHPLDVPGTDRQSEDRVLVFGRLFKLASAGPDADDEINSINKRIEYHHKSKGIITTKNNTLGLTVHHGVTTSEMADLREIAGSTAAGDSDSLDAFGVHFKVSSGSGEFSYEMDPQDFRDILREVRSGKQFSDFLAFTIHWHQNRFAFQKYSFDHYPPSFQVQFAHAVVDNGADLFFAHGVHTLKGVEIYKGKPIFYGLSNFVFHEQMFRSWRDDAGGREPTPLEGPILGDGEINERRWTWLEQDANLVAILASSRYEEGALVEVLLYPADLGLRNRPGSEFGTPKKPSPDVARMILEDVAEYSKPYGTKISIENGVGVIRLAPE